MLDPKIGILIEEVFAFYGERKVDLAKKDPEACLASLLRQIKEYLSEGSVTLEFAVETGTYESGVQDARQWLGRTGLTESRPSAPPRHRTNKSKTKKRVVKATPHLSR